MSLPLESKPWVVSGAQIPWFAMRAHPAPPYLVVYRCLHWVSQLQCSPLLLYLLTSAPPSRLPSSSLLMKPSLERQSFRREEWFSDTRPCVLGGIAWL